METTQPFELVYSDEFGRELDRTLFSQDHFLSSITIPDFFGKTFTWENLGQVNILMGGTCTGKTTFLTKLYTKLIFNDIVKKSERVYYAMWDRRYETGKGYLDNLLDFAKNSDILLIDMPEMGLDLDTQSELIRYILQANPNVQLFIVTHSPTIFRHWQGTWKRIESLIH